MAGHLSDSTAAEMNLWFLRSPCEFLKPHSVKRGTCKIPITRKTGLMVIAATIITIIWHYLISCTCPQIGKLIFQRKVEAKFGLWDESFVSSSPSSPVSCSSTLPWVVALSRWQLWHWTWWSYIVHMCGWLCWAVMSPRKWYQPFVCISSFSLKKELSLSCTMPCTFVYRHCTHIWHGGSWPGVHRHTKCSPQWLWHTMWTDIITRIITILTGIIITIIIMVVTM